jgi:hypothetical protein
VTNNAGGKIISSGGGPTTFLDDVVNNGEIRTSAGSFTTFFGATSGSGAYTGTGTVNFEGDLKPGNSPAAISFAGNMALGVDAALKMELGGLAAGSQYDRVTVAGNLALDGALQVSLTGGFKPAKGNSFDILDWGTRSGTFASVQLPDLGGRIVWDSSQLYTTGALAVTNTFYAGDVNRDSLVDVADISAMMSALADLSKYKTMSSLDDGGLLLVANLTSDNLVNNSDLQGLINLLANGGGSGVGSISAVPEPPAVVLLAPALVL